MKGGNQRKWAGLLVGTGALWGCGGPAPPALVIPPWAEVLEAEPAEEVVLRAPDREAIAATGLPWRVRDRSSGVELLLVPPGDYPRGASDDDDEAGDDERPRHLVRVAEPFYAGRFEVTQAEWQRVMGEPTSQFADRPDHPAEGVTFANAAAFVERSELELLTEAEWEVVCRAGSPEPRYAPLEEAAWYRGNAGQTTHAVGELVPNAWGFHDTLGNVAEWTSTWYVAEDYALAGEVCDAGREPSRGFQRVVRGGSWYDAEGRVRSSARYSSPLDLEAGHIGLRVKRSIGP